MKRAWDRVVSMVAGHRSSVACRNRFDGALPTLQIITRRDSPGLGEVYNFTKSKFPVDEEIVPLWVVEEALERNTSPSTKPFSKYAILALRAPSDEKLLASTTFFVIAPAAETGETAVVGEVYTVTSTEARGWGLLNMLLVAREAYARGVVASVSGEEATTSPLLTFNDVNWPFNMTPMKYEEDKSGSLVSPTERAMIWHRKAYSMVDVVFERPGSSPQETAHIAINVSGANGKGVSSLSFRQMMTHFFLYNEHFFCRGSSEEIGKQQGMCLEKMIGGRTRLPVMNIKKEIAGRLNLPETMPDRQFSARAEHDIDGVVKSNVHSANTIGELIAENGDCRHKRHAGLERKTCPSIRGIESVPA